MYTERIGKEDKILFIAITFSKYPTQGPEYFFTVFLDRIWAQKKNEKKNPLRPGYKDPWYLDN